MKKFLKVLLYVTAILSVLIFSFIIYYNVVTKDVKFEDSKLINKNDSLTVYDLNGEKIDCDYINSNIYVSSENIPLQLKNAFISIEDKRFYSHKGVDYKALARATVKNIFSFSLKEGGSTISQQLIKNTFLTNEKTLNRKLKEYKLTKILEKKYSKDKILETYLNTIYFGEGNYGIYSASKYYFGKDLKDLTISECATLAGIIKAPSKYNPKHNLELSTNRRNLVLSLMKEQNYIDAQTENEQKNQIITLSNSYKNNLTNTYLKKVLEEAYSILGEQTNLSNYKIYTFLDRKIQNKMFSLCKENSFINDFSFMVINNKSGAISSYLSNVGDIKRIPASTVKPFLVYAPCIEENLMTTATKINDEQTSFGNYNPSNYSNKYYGYVNMYQALPLSLNIPAIKTLNTLTIDKCISYAKKMGIEIKNKDLSIALGNIEGGITLKQLGEAYLTLAVGGYYSKTNYIDKIESNNGTVVYKSNRQKTKVFSEQTTFLISDVLKETVSHGTCQKLNNYSFDLCAKTGTNGDKFGNIDVYCVSYTKDHVVLVWFGNSNNEKTKLLTSGGMPSIINNEILSSLYENYSPDNFSVPNGIVKCNIDKYCYETDHSVYLANETDLIKDTLQFYFKEGTEPKKTYQYDNIKIINNIQISYNKGIVNISFNLKGYDGVEIYREFGNTQTLISKDCKNSIVDDISKEQSGRYDYYLKTYYYRGNSKIYGENIKLKSVKHDKYEDIKNIDWWND